MGFLNIIKPIKWIIYENAVDTRHSQLKIIKSLAVCGGFLCFIPLMLNYSIETKRNDGFINPNFHEITTSMKLYCSFASSISSFLPMVLDVALDFTLTLSRRTAVFILPQKAIVLGVVIPHIIILVYLLPYHKFEWLFCVLASQDILFNCIFLLFMHHLAPDIWTKNSITVIALCVSVSDILLSLVTFDGAFSGNMVEVLRVWIQVLIGIAAFALASIYHQWSRHLPSGREELRSLSILPGVAYGVFLATSWMNFFVPQLRDNQFWNQTGVNTVTMYTVVLVLTGVTMTVVHNRIQRLESVEAKEELDFKRMFVRYISHEVRTPLNTAIMGLQVLQEEIQQQVLQQQEHKQRLLSGGFENLETIADIRKSCDVAVSTLNELLTFDKLESGTLMLEKTAVRAWDLIDDTVHPLQVQARQSRVMLTVSCKRLEKMEQLMDVEISADVIKIAQVIRNIVSNALKFTPPGGSVAVEVDTLDMSASGDGCLQMLCVEVTDTGAGISAENQKRLFKEIVQFNPAKLQKGGGSGLGLYISSGIVKMHQGRLTVFSKGEGYGSTFSLYLPVHKPQLSAASISVSHSNRKRCVVAPAADSRISPELSWVSLEKVSSQAWKHERGKQPGHGPQHVSVGSDMDIPQVVSDLSLNSKIEQSTTCQLPSGDVGVVLANSSSIYLGRRGSRFRKISKTTVPLTASSPAFPFSRAPFQVIGTTTFLLKKDSIPFKSKSPPFLVERAPSKDDDSSNHPSIGPREDKAHSSKESPIFVHLPTTPSSNSNGAAYVTKESGAVSVSDSRDGASSSQNSQNFIFNLNILVVDDSVTNRKMQSRLLKRRCRSCYEAGNGLEAIAKIESVLELADKARCEGRVAPIETIDVVLMDANMPIMGGHEATKILRDMGYEGVIVGVTGDARADDIDRFLEHGADIVLPKPFDVKNFDVAMSKLFERRD